VSDYLRLRNLVFHAYHGLLPEEARLGQRFEVDVELLLDVAAAGIEDNPKLTIDYTDVIDLVEEVVTQRRFGLVEALAEAIAGEIHERFPQLDGAIVRVRKPNPPVKATFDGLEVEIERYWSSP
jgi:7,8-dihydroneopterin aldolase/epimerase/oxygenase